GAGPFRLKECRPGKYTLLERNPEFWMADTQGRRLPYLDEVLVNVNGTPVSDADQFLSGKCDACDAVKPERFAQFKEAAGRQGFQLLDLGIGVERDFLWFNQNTGTNATGQPLVPPAKLKWFRAKKFRQPVSCAIDRDRLVKQAYHGRGQAAYGFLSTENKKWNNPNVARYDFNLDKARALLTEIGFQNPNADGVLKDNEGHLLEILFI